MYYKLEGELEELIQTEQTKKDSRYSKLLDKIINTEKDLRENGVNSTMLASYSSLQCEYTRLLMGFAYRIGKEHESRKKIIVRSVSHRSEKMGNPFTSVHYSRYVGRQRKI